MTDAPLPSHLIPRAFPGITPPEVEELMTRCRVHSYPAGTILCRENQVEDTFYMILDGEAEVTKQLTNTEARLLTTLHIGDFFGEMALLQNAPRAATVVARTRLLTLELDQAGFQLVLHHSSSIAIAMVKEISRRLRNNDDMATAELRLRAGELADAYQKLAEQELARREFLSNVSHELRTPLMTASGYLQILQKGVLSGDQMTEVINIVSRNVAKIADRVNDILFLQEIDLVLAEFQPVDLAAIIRLILNRYDEKRREHNVEIVMLGSLDAPQVAGDAKSLERAVAALIDNAIKFSPHGGDVEISLDALADDVILSVTDHGIGIAPEALPHVFERFYHRERSEGELFDGIGIGLAIARQVIEQHHGTITVESTPGKGSMFRVSLPKWGMKKDEPAPLPVV